MTTAAMSYIFSPLSGLWSSLERTLLIMGHSRAAAELARMGYHDAAKSVMLDLKELRDGR